MDPMKFCKFTFLFFSFFLWTMLTMKNGRTVNLHWSFLKLYRYNRINLILLIYIFRSTTFDERGKSTSSFRYVIKNLSILDLFLVTRYTLAAQNIVRKKPINLSVACCVFHRHYFLNDPRVWVHWNLCDFSF